jgi:peptide-methionine (R)-S-oxide reductase
MMIERFSKDLNPEQLRVMRDRDTERPYSGKYWDHDEHGVYTCAGCGTALFTSLAKFDAKNGHPTFSGPINGEDATLAGTDDPTKSEVTCTQCGGHLGYRAKGAKGETEEWVINSGALGFLGVPDLPEGEEREADKTEREEAAPRRPRTTPPVSLVNILALLAAAVVGGGIGGAYASTRCATNELLQATSTPPATPAAAPSPTVAVPATTQTVASPSPGSSAGASLVSEPGGGATEAATSSGEGTATSSDGTSTSGSI